MLTEKERLVLAHVVEDPEGWYDHVLQVYPAQAKEMLAAKVARWAPEYEAAVAKGDYKNRKERGY